MFLQSGILKQVGNTPLVRLSNALAGQDNGVLYAKLEFFNPLGSIKERIALKMIEDLERQGSLEKDTVIVEATSGNTGIGIAFVCAVKGYRCKIVMPENMSVERRKVLEYLGAELVLTSSDEGMEGAVKTARKLALDDNCVELKQFENPANPMAHFTTTGPELWEQMKGDIDAVVCAIGTGGTISGIGKFLKARDKRIKITGVLPRSFPHKIQGIGAGFTPRTLDMSVVDEVLYVKDEQAFEYMGLLSRAEGIFAGISSGAVMWAMCELSKRSEFKGRNIVGIFADGGFKYISTTRH